MMAPGSIYQPVTPNKRAKISMQAARRQSEMLSGYANASCVMARLPPNGRGVRL